jgi:hypothetical protein
VEVLSVRRADSEGGEGELYCSVVRGILPLSEKVTSYQLPPYTGVGMPVLSIWMMFR